MSMTEKLTVALVEDDRLLREEIENHLTAHGFVIHAAIAGIFVAIAE